MVRVLLSIAQRTIRFRNTPTMLSGTSWTYAIPKASRIQQIKEEAQQTFDLGLLELESKAKIDSIYWQLATQIVGMHRGLRFIPDEVKELETSLGDQYICNFSVFQSLLDHWALD